MNSSQQNRLWIVVGGLSLAAMIIIGRLMVFQIVESSQWAERGESAHTLEVIAKPDRGIIYDRNGAVLAANGADYQIGASPSLIINPEEVATALAPTLRYSGQARI